MAAYFRCAVVSGQSANGPLPARNCHQNGAGRSTCVCLSSLGFYRGIRYNELEATLTTKPFTRAKRFLVVRDAIMANSHRMRRVSPDWRELICGSFLVNYCPPGASGPLRGFNLQIWKGRRVEEGLFLHDNKVANVDWDQDDIVDILSYRSGPWEEELLSLLRPTANVAYFGTVTR